MNKGEIYSGFEITRVRDLPDHEAVLYEMTHIQTGAQLCWLKRDDVNKTFAIGFKTLPEDDTGVFHIIEHTVLNGSRKYPVREPFVELLKTSMQTFLNAMTYPDRTLYPVSSRNKQDFMNLMSVYLDAVFYPEIYRNRNIFYQEGWHYEIHDPEEEPIYKGVVFNEMKGAFSSVDETIVAELNRILFPDNCYRFISGGDPEKITDLSYEQYIATHAKYYHPTNARIVLDGDLDIEEVLAYIDGEYLSHFTKEEADFTIPDQEPVKAVHRTYEYEVSESDELKDKTQIAMAKIVSECDDIRKNIAWNVLASLLTANNESLLKKSILDKGLGQDVEMDLSGGIQQPWAVLLVRNTNAEHYDEVMRTLKEAAQKLTDGGLDHERIKASLNQMEFSYHEKHEPAGVIFAAKMMETWNFEKDPAIAFTCSGVYEELRQAADTGYFEELIREFFLDDEHLCTVMAVPSKELGRKRLEKEQQKLHDAKQSWENVQEYIDRTNALELWQNTPDTKEQIDTLPKLKLSEVEPKPERYEAEERTLRGVPVLLYPDNERGIVYGNFYFSLAGVTKERLPYVSAYTGLLLNVPTKNKTVEELQEAIRRDAGTLSISIDAYTPDLNPDVCIPVISAGFPCLKKNLNSVLDLIREVLMESVFPKDSILALLQQDMEELRQNAIMAGHSLASRRLGAAGTAEGAFRECVNGYTFAAFEKDLIEHYGDRADELIAECEMFRDVLYSRDRLTISFSSEELLPAVEEWMTQLHDIPAERAVVHYKRTERRSEALEIPAGISFAVLATPLEHSGNEYDAGMMVLSHYLTYQYLWNEIRVHGGAYGTGCSIGSLGSLAAYSYRDPSPLRSLDIFRSIAAEIRSLKDTDLDMEGFIIGTLAGASPLQTPIARIRTADAAWFRKMTYEKRCENRSRILSMTKEDMVSFADRLEPLIAEASTFVVGPKTVMDQLEKEGVTILRSL